MNLINCPNCQNQINQNNNMCPYCGNTINQNISNINHQIKGIQKKKITNSLKIGIYIIIGFSLGITPLLLKEIKQLNNRNQENNEIIENIKTEDKANTVIDNNQNEEIINTEQEKDTDKKEEQNYKNNQQQNQNSNSSNNTTNNETDKKQDTTISDNSNTNNNQNKENINTEQEKIIFTINDGDKITSIANKINKKTKYSYDEIITTIDDREYLKTLINKYEFLSPDILNENIYHPLEGYLLSGTYNFNYDASLKYIIESILDNTKNKLASYINNRNNNLTFNETIIMASIVELEGISEKEKVAGVFFNRLNSGISLGSDVTVYYGAKKDFSSNITSSDLNSNNGYNTRKKIGLPIGAICSPSISSIIATLNYEKHNYYYYVYDKNKKIYLFENVQQHYNTIQKLKEENLWY